MDRIQPRELLFPLGVGIAVVVLGTLPYLYAYHTQGAGEVFMGFIGRGTPGANGYFMFARQAVEGHWLFVNQMTPEPTPRAYFSLQWLAFGLFSKWTGLSLVATFHLGRVLSVLLYVLAVYYLAAQCLEDAFRRRLALCLTVFGSGLGWMIWAVNKTLHAGLPLSFDLQGVSIFGYLINNPHFIRAGLCSALQYAFLIRGEQSGRLRYFVFSGLASEGHSIIRPYHVPETFLVYALFPILLCIRERRLVPRRILNYGVAALVALPGALYLVITTLSNVLGMAGWFRQSPLLLEQILWVGLPFLAVCGYFAFFGMADARQAKPSSLMLSAWLGLSWLLVNAFPYFNAGFEQAFAAFTLAPPILLMRGPLPLLHDRLASGFPRLAAAFARKQVQYLAAIALVLLCSPSSVYVYARFFKDLHHPVPPWRYYLDSGVHNAITWLETNARTNDVVLASHDTSQFVPRMSACKVVSGHDMLTANYYEKNRLVDRFFRIRGEDGFKRWLADTFNVHYVVFGPYERYGGGMDPADHPWLHEEFRHGNTTVYRVAIDKPPVR